MPLPCSRPHPISIGSCIVPSTDRHVHRKSQPFQEGWVSLRPSSTNPLVPTPSGTSGEGTYPQPTRRWHSVVATLGVSRTICAFWFDRGMSSAEDILASLGGASAASLGTKLSHALLRMNARDFGSVPCPPISPNLQDVSGGKQGECDILAQPLMSPRDCSVTGFTQPPCSVCRGVVGFGAIGSWELQTAPSPDLSRPLTALIPC
mmetsp:Transcript_71311/g.125492  ORF Transcript_71311/g.125492 Transcript_71311/m.125492 type:complete len:205 (+) Transcript_71311:1797-2411(+)